MPHFDPDSSDRERFVLLKKRERSFFFDVAVPAIQLLGIFIILRLGMFAFHMPLVWIPGIDNVVAPVVAWVEEKADRRKR